MEKNSTKKLPRNGSYYIPESELLKEYSGYSLKQQEELGYVVRKNMGKQVEEKRGRHISDQSIYPNFNGRQKRKESFREPLRGILRNKSEKPSSVPSSDDPEQNYWQKRLNNAGVVLSDEILPREESIKKLGERNLEKATMVHKVRFSEKIKYF